MKRRAISGVSISNACNSRYNEVGCFEVRRTPRTRSVLASFRESHYVYPGATLPRYSLRHFARLK